MYPDRFPRNAWYVAARSAEVTEALLSRWILGDPIVLYRKLDGAAVALIDRCVHRQMPLSLGRRKDDNIECGYHGLTYAPDGTCTRIPGADRVPKRIRVQSFPLYEKFGLIWIWMGDPARADESAIPDHHWYTASGWSTAAGTLHMNARAQLLNENLLDLSHLSYLHPESIGSPEIAEIPVRIDFDERWVQVHREMLDVTCPPLFTKLMGIDGRIDRQQTADFFAPAFHITTTTVKPTGDADDSRMCRQKTMHAITPETRTTTHYFWSVSRDFGLGQDWVTEYMLTAVKKVFEQDINACEAVEHIIAAWEPDYPIELNIKVDGGPLRARRILERMGKEEFGTSRTKLDHPSDRAARAAARASRER